MKGTNEVNFDNVVKQNIEKVYWLIRKMVICHEDANDLTQETFVKAWSNIEQFNHKSKISTWIYRIAVNESLTFLNKKKKMTAYTLEDAGYLTSELNQSVLISSDKIELELQRVLLQLPDKQRLVFNLKYFEDKNYKEIAEITNTSIGSLKANYHHAVQKIKKTISL